MSESKAPMGPMGFPAPSREGDRDGWRLLFVVVSIVVAGAAAFAVITLGLA